MTAILRTQLTIQCVWERMATTTTTATTTSVAATTTTEKEMMASNLNLSGHWELLTRPSFLATRLPHIIDWLTIMSRTSKEPDDLRIWHAQITFKARLSMIKHGIFALSI